MTIKGVRNFKRINYILNIIVDHISAKLTRHDVVMLLMTM